MPRDSRVYLEDILASVAKIRSYVGAMDAAARLPDFERRVQTLLEGVGG
jgi:uncharacterized protein with HEPN domain